MVVGVGSESVTDLTPAKQIFLAISTPNPLNPTTNTSEAAIRFIATRDSCQSDDQPPAPPPQPLVKIKLTLMPEHITRQPHISHKF